MKKNKSNKRSVVWGHFFVAEDYMTPWVGIINIALNKMTTIFISTLLKTCSCIFPWISLNTDNYHLICNKWLLLNLHICAGQATSCGINQSWWRHQMETFSALLAICTGNSPLAGEFPAQRPVTRNFDVFFDLRLNKRLCKQSRGWWSEKQSCPLRRHCNDDHPVLTAIVQYVGVA